MPRKPSSSVLEAKITAAALDLAARRPWRHITLWDIAEAADLSFADVYGQAPDKLAVLDLIRHRFDHDMMKGLEAPAADMSVRERLFDVIMARLDALTPHREALLSIARSLGCDPQALLCGGFGLARSLAAMLEAAGVSSTGLCGLVRIKGLAVIWLSTVNVWRHDGADLAKTMAHLDRTLTRAEKLMRLTPCASEPRADARPAPPAPSAPRPQSAS